MNAEGVMCFSRGFSSLCSGWLCGEAVPPGHSVPWAPGTELLGTRASLGSFLCSVELQTVLGGTCRGRVARAVICGHRHKGASLRWLQNEMCQEGLAGSRWKGLCRAEWRGAVTGGSGAGFW